MVEHNGPKSCSCFFVMLQKERTFLNNILVLYVRANRGLRFGKALENGSIDWTVCTHSLIDII